MKGPHADEGGAAEVLHVERASAVAALPAPRARRRTRRPPPARPLALPELQRWFLDALVDRPDGPVAAVLADGPALSAAARLEGMRGAYVARLVECLADDYPGVAAFLGPARFDALARRVIRRHPSRHANLNHYGRVLVDEAPRGFLRELARLEWALVEAVHAPTPPRLDPARLAAFTPAQWGAAVFVPSPALRVLSGAWPVNRWYQAFREGSPGPRPPRGASAVAVYRKGTRVWRMDLAPLPLRLLGALVDGVPLGPALAPLEGEAGAGAVMAWFQAWVREGLFADVRDGTASAP